MQEVCVEEAVRNGKYAIVDGSSCELQKFEGHDGKLPSSIKVGRENAHRMKVVSML